MNFTQTSIQKNTRSLTLPLFDIKNVKLYSIWKKRIQQCIIMFQMEWILLWPTPGRRQN